jgi:MFS transporter, DHA1 family, inner membrane transport protein
MFDRKETFLLASLATAKFTHIMDFMVMMPLGPQLMRILSIDTQQFGILVSSYTISAGIAALISAFFIDRFDRKSALMFAYTGFIIGTLLCALSNTYELLTMARIFTGVFGGLLNTLTLAIVGDLFQLQKRATATGIVMAAMSAAAAFGVPVGLYFSTIYGWNMPFYIIVGAALPIWFGLYYFVPSVKGHLLRAADEARPRFFDSLRATFTNANQVRGLLLSMSLVLGQFMIIPFIAPFMVKNIGFSEFELTYIYLIGGTVSLFTGPFIGKLADKYGHKLAFFWLAAFSCLPMLLITQMPPVPIGVALIATSLFFILIGGRIIPSTTMLISSIDGRNRASFMSFNTAFQQLAAGAAALLSGSILVDTPKALINYEYIGYLGIGLTIIAMALAYSLRPPVQTPVAAH